MQSPLPALLPLPSSWFRALELSPSSLFCLHSLPGCFFFFFKSHQRLVLYLLSLYWSYTRSPNISWVQFFFCLFNYMLSICSWISNRYLILNMSKIRPLIPNLPPSARPASLLLPHFLPNSTNGTAVCQDTQSKNLNIITSPRADPFSSIFIMSQVVPCITTSPAVTSVAVISWTMAVASKLVSLGQLLHLCDQFFIPQWEQLLENINQVVAFPCSELLNGFPSRVK